MPFTTSTFGNEIAELFFKNTNIANIGDATGLRGASTAGSWYLSLHTALPTTQSSSETTYGSYARVAIARSGVGWTVSGRNASNTAAATFPKSTDAVADVLYYAGLGTDSSGAGNLKYIFPIGVRKGMVLGESTNDTLTCKGHGLSVSDKVAFFGDGITSLPTGITEGTIYFVKTVSGDDITISTTDGGATLDITADGQGILFKMTPVTMALNVRPQFDAGDLDIYT